MPPTLEHETTEALLCRLTRLGDMYARLMSDASTRGLDHDDLINALKSTIRVIDCVRSSAARTWTTSPKAAVSPR